MQLPRCHFKESRRCRLALWIWLPAFVVLAHRVSAQPDIYGKPDSSAFIRIRSDADDWTRHFRIGALVGMNISANFSMGNNFNIKHPTGIYDDGYVRQDNNGNANGQTAFWGYEHDSQYNLADQTLSMHANTAFSTSGGGGGTADGGVFPGIDMAYGDNLWYWKHARVGWELGFDWLPINLKQNTSLRDVNVTQTTYVFHTGWPSGVPIDSAPYHGLPNAGSGEPTISDTQTNFSQSYSGTVNGSQSLDLMYYSFRFGPSFYWDLTDNIGMSLGAGGAIGIVSGDYKYDETVTANGISTHNRGSFGSTDIVYGGYVNATVLYHLVDNGDIYLGVQYTPMTDASFNGPSRSARLNMGGQLYFTIGINWPF